MNVPFVLVLYLNIEKLAEAHGWDGLLLGVWVSYTPAFYEHLTKPWLLISAVAIVSFTVGIWADAFLRSREQGLRLTQTGNATSDLADRADNLSKKLYELLGQFPGRPPTHPNFKQHEKHDSEGWWRHNHEQRERILTRFLEQHAAEAWMIIEGSKNYIQLENSEIWRVSHISSDHDVSEMARMMALVAARLRLVLSGELPIAVTKNSW